MTNKSRLVKVVYFDEEAALNYLDIFNHGKTEKTKEMSTTSKALADAGIEVKLPLFPFLKGRAKANASAEGARLVKNKISNTVLSDFLDNKKFSSSFTKLEDYKLSIYPNSLTAIKTLSPILNVLKGEMSVDTVNSLSIEVSKMSEMFNNLKGYSEFLAISENDKNVFRFNDIAFKNNYHVLDMTGMSVVYYGVEVGSLDDLSGLEFDVVTKPSVRGSLDPLDRIDQITSDQKAEQVQRDDTKQIKVYDIVLAGMFVDE